jgi:hypothetical protein
MWHPEKGHRIVLSHEPRLLDALNNNVIWWPNWDYHITIHFCNIEIELGVFKIKWPMNKETNIQPWD